MAQTTAHTLPKTLGVLGGGQLGRMFVHAAQRMGFFTAVLDPDPHSPAGRVSHHHICTEYTDPAGLARLSELAVAVTTEFENVPAAALTALAQHRPVAPGAAAVAIAQDRAAEKAYFAQCGVPCAPYAVVETEAQLAAVPDAVLPGILKTSRMGYDGKGQARVRDRAELHRAWHALRGVPCVLEKMLPLQAECSVIVARGRDGQCVHLPIQRNLHRDGILAVTEVYEGNLPSALAARAVAAAQSIAQGLDYVGVLCVEFFVLDVEQPAAQGLGDLVVNEIAPRPHNSGHYSIDACDLSQFELQVRTLAGLPLVQPRQHSAAVMLNLLGDLWHGGHARAHGSSQGGAKHPAHALAPDADHPGAQAAAKEPPWAQVLALPGSHLHLYGKGEAKSGRKMGHLTVTGASPEQARARANAAARVLGLPLV
jgi:5-(carboxyamino)imidazole ribonucleotide synthase